ncbi:MerR family transcriptional regulator [bacterium]|nr:MerR family transcriptional regulator [bacterium]
MGRNGSGEEARHPIGVVSSRTGLPQDVLRAWERRYAAVVPHRTETGRRLYTDTDLEKLRLLRLAVDSGRRISDVAKLELEELDALVREDLATAPLGPRSGRRSRPAPADSDADFLERALEAAVNLDARRLESLLAEASVQRTAASLRRDIIRPLLEHLGAGWRDGSIRIAQEHLASAVVRSFLGTLRGREDVRRGAPAVIVTTPAGQRHELGALLAAMAAGELGWDAVYLGPSLPAPEIASAARERDARAIALSLIWPASDAGVMSELRDLRRLVGPDVAVFAGGSAAASYADVLAEIGAGIVDEGSAFQSALEGLDR